MKLLRFLANYHIEVICIASLTYFAAWVISGVAIYGIH